MVVSGDTSFAGARDALTRGAFDFVKKPYEAAELLAALEKALRHRELEQRNVHIVITSYSIHYTKLYDDRVSQSAINGRNKSTTGTPQLAHWRNDTSLPVVVW